MTEQTRAILAQVLRLPEDERAELVAEIMATLDGGAEALDREWAAEIEQRIEGYLAGRDKAVPWDEVRAEGQKRLRGQ